MTFNYKKYSLEKLEEWMHDALSCEDATPQEIYDVIKSVVSENYYTYKIHTERCYELLALLNGNGEGHVTNKGKEVDNGMRPWGHSDMEYLVSNSDQFTTKSYTKEELDAMWSTPEEKKKPIPDMTYQEGIDAGFEMTDDGFWVKAKNQEDKWKLPIEVDGLSGECYVNLPDDLMEVANIKENDLVEWIDRKDGSFELRKVNEESEQSRCG
jgi:hypothetical protein